MWNRLFNRISETTVTDPVCNMKVDMRNPGGGMWEYDSEKYYFCGPGCNLSFKKEPEAYISGEKRVDM